MSDWYDRCLWSLQVLLEEQSFVFTDNPQGSPSLLQFLDFLSGLSEIGFTADYTEVLYQIFIFFVLDT